MKSIHTKCFTMSHILALCLCLVALSGLPLHVNATVFDGGAASTDYNDPLNWENDMLPGDSSAGDFAIIGQVGVAADTTPFLNPAVVDLSATPASVNLPGDLRVGNGPDGDGTLNHTAGDLTTNPGNWSGIGQDGTASNPSIGRYNMSGTATFNSGDPLSLGLDGGSHAAGSPNQGFLTIADSAALNVGALNVGRNDDNYGQVDQTGGTVAVANWVNIGDENGAIGVYNMSSGSFTAGEYSIGQKLGAKGTLNISGDASTIVSGGLRVGREAGGEGWLNIDGSDVTLSAGDFTVGGDTSEGTVNFVADASGVSPILSAGDVSLNDGSVAGFANLTVDMSLAPAGDILLIDVGGAINGTFSGLPQGAAVPNSGGRFIDYTYGDGNNIALVIPEPATLMLCITGLGASLCRRRQ